MVMRLPIVLGVILLLGACESAYYGVQEKFGNLKNDILVDRVEDAMEAQEDAKEEFKSALEQFEAVVGVPESELKSVYNKLNNSFEDAEDKAEVVSDRIASVEDVSEDLFEEWEDEIQQISSASLRSKSTAKLKASKRSYADLIKAMKRAEARMAPVLTSFRDHVLYLKHNLNAQAIASLQGDLGGIENDVGRLIAEMERSIAEAQSFIKTMESG
jgi:uncharacterized protein YoxC